MKEVKLGQVQGTIRGRQKDQELAVSVRLCRFRIEAELDVPLLVPQKPILYSVTALLSNLNTCYTVHHTVGAHDVR